MQKLMKNMLTNSISNCDAIIQHFLYKDEIVLNHAEFESKVAEEGMVV